MASLPSNQPGPLLVGPSEPVPSSRRDPGSPWAPGFVEAPIWRYAFLALCVAALLGTAGLYLLSLTNYLSVEGDNAVYIILAKAMATGHGYTDIQGPAPRIEAQYPFLFPVFLTPIVFAFGAGAFLLMELVVTLFALGAFVVCFFLFRRWLGSAPLALVVTVAAATSSLIWSYSHKVLTEIPYLFFTVVACWFATVYAEEDNPYTRAGLLAAAATAAAFLTRTIGMSLCVALPLFLLFAAPLPTERTEWWKRIQKVLLTGAVLVVTAGAWTLRNRMAFSGQGHNYIGQFFLKQAYVPDAGKVSSGELFSRVRENFAYYAREFQHMLLGSGWDGVFILGSISLLLLVVCLGGFIYALAARRTLAEPYMILYVLIVLLWPWKDLRFAVPVLPFLVYYFAQAVSLLASLPWRLRKIDPRLIATVILIPIFGRSGYLTLRTAQADHHAGYHYEVGRLGEWRAYADWRDFHAAAIWLEQNAPSGSTVINRSPNLFYLWTGLASRNYPYIFNLQAMMHDLGSDHRDFVIYDDFDWTYTTKQYLRPVIKRYPSHFQAVAHFHGTVVYEVLKGKSVGKHG